MKTFKRYIIHEDFNKTALFDSDIALIELDEPLEYSSNIRPACLQDSTYINRRLLEDRRTSLSWGRVVGCGRQGSRGSSNLPENFQSLYMPYVKREDCIYNLNGSRFQVILTNNMFCAGKLNRDVGDVCAGDAGGGLLMEVHGEFRWVLTGIVSFGIGGCDNPHSYSMFTNVGNFYEWIIEHTHFTEEVVDTSFMDDRRSMAGMVRMVALHGDVWGRGTTADPTCWFSGLNGWVGQLRRFREGAVSSRDPSGRVCTENVQQTKLCNNGACPVDGVWLSWSEWSECSLTCGDQLGLSTRNRTCFYSPDRPLGDTCPRATSASKYCAAGKCPICKPFTVTDDAWRPCNGPTESCDFPVSCRVSDEGRFHRLTRRWLGTGKPIDMCCSYLRVDQLGHVTIEQHTDCIDCPAKSFLICEYKQPPGISTVFDQWYAITGSLKGTLITSITDTHEACIHKCMSMSAKLSTQGPKLNALLDGRSSSSSSSPWPV
ncbi:FA9-like protein [Mya arenaria]|uniref:FA9-like protein n=1 Tax=Mya arenaria TaxID=6604 RepID=A0ABY7FTZ2_MYAAR|nr:FA9-like protein [Mya arenaria]